MPLDTSVHSDLSQPRLTGTVSFMDIDSFHQVSLRPQPTQKQNVISVVMSSPSQEGRLLTRNLKTPQGQPDTPINSRDHVTLSQLLTCVHGLKSKQTRIAVTSVCVPPSPINEQGLPLPRAIIQPRLSLFLCVSNGHDATIHKSREINYRNHLRGAP